MHYYLNIQILIFIFLAGQLCPQISIVSFVHKSLESSTNKVVMCNDIRADSCICGHKNLHVNKIGNHADVIPYLIYAGGSGGTVCSLPNLFTLQSQHEWCRLPYGVFDTCPHPLQQNHIRMHHYIQRTKKTSTYR